MLLGFPVSVILAVVGVMLIVLGLLIRAGRMRVALALYEYEALPDYTRNGAFTLVPIGVTCLLGAAAAELANKDPEWVGVVATLLFVVALVITIWWTFRPPEWMKPAWLREYEASGGEGQERQPMRIPVPSFLYVGLWLAWGVLLVLWLLFDWSLSFLAGICFGAAFLFGVKPYSGRPPPPTRLLRTILRDRIPKDQ